MRNARRVLCAALALILTACTLAQITQVINAAVLIAEQAAAVSGANIPPQYFAYVSAASNCIAFAATEQASTDPAVIKAAKITQACAQYTSVALPPGTAQNLVTWVRKLASSIQNILDELPPVGAQAKSSTPAKPDVMSASDVKALRALAGRAELAKVKAESAKR